MQLVLVAMALWLQDSIMVILQLLFQAFTKRGLVVMHVFRVPCDYKNKNLSTGVEESSQKPHNYLAIELLYQGGQTEIVAIDVAQVSSANWKFKSRKYGAIWDITNVPNGPLQFRFSVTSGFDGKWLCAQSVLPEDWKNGVVYDTGLLITDIAKEGCSPCHDEAWK
ncbi:Expansin-like A2 [Abeliophyllum distichum]|uniref:Expansin-like A2 n=1 Tax=Abeliophyllum distichum TaxID=126358 RepID=A0ABD1RS30_9LAMI